LTTPLSHGAVLVPQAGTADMEFLKSFDLSRSWNRLAAIGAGLAAVGVPAHHAPIILIGLGMIAIGFGEGKNHRQATSISRPDAFGYRLKKTDFERQNTTLGISADCIGGGLVCVGLLKLIFS